MQPGIPMSGRNSAEFNPAGLPEHLVASGGFSEPTMLFGGQALDYAHYTGQGGFVAATATLPSIHRPQTGVTSWARQQQDLYFRLEDQAKALAQARANLPNVEAQVRSLKASRDHAASRLQLAQNALSEARGYLKRQEDKLKSTIFGKDKYNAKVVSARDSVQAAEQAVAEAAPALALAEQQLAGPTAELVRLRDVASQHQQTDEQMAQILAALFSGAAGDPAENQAEGLVTTYATIQPQIDAALRDQEHALKYVSRAVQSMGAMYDQLRAALMSERMAMTSNTINRLNGPRRNTMGVVGTMSSMNTSIRMRQAAELAKDAEKNLMLAIQFSPYMPIAKSGRVGLDPLVGIANILFSSPVLNVMVMGRIQKQMQSMQPTYAAAVSSQAWQTSFVANIARDKTANDSNLANARHRLLLERIRLIHELRRAHSPQPM